MMRLRRLDDVAALARARLFLRRYWPSIVVAVLQVAVMAGAAAWLSAHGARR